MRRSQPASRVSPRGRRIKVQQFDELEICGFIVDAEILAAVLDPRNRTLWAFVNDGKGRVQPTAYTEEQVIWLTPEDIAVGVK